MKRLIHLLCVLLLLASTLFAQPRSTSDAKTPTIAEKVAGMQKFPGYFPFYWDAKAGKVWLEIDKWNSEFLYVESLPAGIGSNDLGLDRGQLGQSHIVRFERTGPRILRDGFFLQAANPKALLFFTAILPQFIDAHRNVVFQVLVLGISSIVVEFSILFTYGQLAGRALATARSPRFEKVTNRIAGSLLIGAGIGLARLRRT